MALFGSIRFDNWYLVSPIIMVNEIVGLRRPLGARSHGSTVTAHRAGVGNRLLAALPAADLGLLTPYFQKVSFEPDAVLVRSGEELDPVYFPHSGAIAFMLDMPDGQTVATTLMGREGALASFSVLGPSPSSVTAIARVAGTASLISAAKFRAAFAQSAAIRHVVQVHARAVLLQLQHVAACNALHRVDGRMARWLLQLHVRVPDDMLPVTQEALAQLLGVRRTTVTLTMSKLREVGAVPSDRRGFVEIDRARLEKAACHCYALMQRTIDQMYCEELAASPPAPGEQKMPAWSGAADRAFPR